ncbi:TPA: hypothetical protein ACH3X1_009689 [Trebouxia sp. C0004]
MSFHAVPQSLCSTSFLIASCCTPSVPAAYPLCHSQDDFAGIGILWARQIQSCPGWRVVQRVLHLDKLCRKGDEKKRKDYTFWHQFSEKPSINRAAQDTLCSDQAAMTSFRSLVPNWPLSC